MRAVILSAMVLALAACGGAEQANPVAEKQAAPASAVVASAPVAASVASAASSASDAQITVNAIGVTAKELAAGTTPSLRVSPPMTGAAVTVSCASA